MNFAVKPLGELCSLTMGRTPPRGNSKFWDSSHKTKNIWISIADMSKSVDGILIDSKEYLSDEGSKTFPKVKKGTLLLSFKLSIGKLAIAGTELQTNEAIVAMNELNEDLITRDYLYYFLFGFDWSGELEGRFKVKGNTLNKKILEALPIKFPPLKKQREIVERLDRAFAGIDLIEANLEQFDEKVDQLFKSILNYSLKKITNPSESSYPSADRGVARSDQFSTGSIDEFCNVEYGTRVVRKKDAGTIYPVYGGGGETFFLDTFNRENRVVVARFAMSEKCTRRIAGKFALNDSGLTLSPKDSTRISQDYLDYLVLSMNDQIYASARGTAQKNLDVPAFRQMEISFPVSSERQREIVENLDKTLIEVDLLRSQIRMRKDFAIALRNSLLSAAFTDAKEVA
jgi:restriction endonuclease S subunit